MVMGDLNLMVLMVMDQNLMVHIMEVPDGVHNQVHNNQHIQNNQHIHNNKDTHKQDTHNNQHIANKKNNLILLMNIL
jgi:ABC-type nickel/cobalt efflux system permease component RcnA